MNLQRIREVGRGVGRLISDRMSYRNHYMCSGEATSFNYFNTEHILANTQIVKRFDIMNSLIIF